MLYDRFKVRVAKRSRGCFEFERLDATPAIGACPSICEGRMIFNLRSSTWRSTLGEAALVPGF